jgi:hypothetical protein
MSGIPRSQSQHMFSKTPAGRAAATDLSHSQHMYSKRRQQNKQQPLLTYLGHVPQGNQTLLVTCSKRRVLLTVECLLNRCLVDAT